MKLQTKKCIVCGRTTKAFAINLFDDRYGSLGYYSVNKCRYCGFGRTDPTIAKRKIGEFYKKYYPLSSVNANEIKKSAKVINPLLAWLTGLNSTAYWRIRKNSDVLDIGSGSGISLLEIKKLGARAYGIEPDPNAQKIAKQLKLNVYKGFITDNPYKSQKFDYITANQVFEHEPNPKRFLKSVKRKLKTNGKVILSIPNFDSIYLTIFGNRWVNWHVPYHINFFTKTSIERLTKRVGFRIVDTKTITPNGWTLLQFLSLIKNPKMGEKSLVWSNISPVGNHKSKFNLGKTVLHVIASLFNVLITPTNRLIDVLGKGDCLFVVLENEKN